MALMSAWPPHLPAPAPPEAPERANAGSCLRGAARAEEAQGAGSCRGGRRPFHRGGHCGAQGMRVPAPSAGRRAREARWAEAPALLSQLRSNCESANASAAAPRLVPPPPSPLAQAPPAPSPRPALGPCISRRDALRAALLIPALGVLVQSPVPAQAAAVAAEEDVASRVYEVPLPPPKVPPLSSFLLFTQTIAAA